MHVEPLSDFGVELHSRAHAGQCTRVPYSVLEVVDVDLRVLVDERYALPSSSGLAVVDLALLLLARQVKSVDSEGARSDRLKVTKSLMLSLLRCLSMSIDSRKARPRRTSAETQDPG
jgi:hypothetical protein